MEAAHHQYVRQLFKLADVVKGLSHDGLLLAEYLGEEIIENTPALIDFLPHTLSGISWIVSISQLTKRQVTDDEEETVRKWLVACSDHDSCGGYSTHPQEPAGVLGLLAAATIARNIPHCATPACINAKQLLNCLVPLPEEEGVLYFRQTLESCSFADAAVDLRICYAAMAYLAMTESQNSSVRQQGPGWNRPGFWKTVLSEDQRIGLLSMAGRCWSSITGGFGGSPDSESHAGHTYCAVSLISMLEGWKHSSVARVNVDLLKWWLKERNLCNGGFNGRPGKASDVCYSFWVGASWNNMGNNLWELPFADLALRALYDCVLPSGGISKHNRLHKHGLLSMMTSMESDATPDPFHTNFGFAAISLFANCPTTEASHEQIKAAALAALTDEESTFTLKGLRPIDPFFAVAQ